MIKKITMLRKYLCFIFSCLSFFSKAQTITDTIPDSLLAKPPYIDLLYTDENGKNYIYTKTEYFQENRHQFVVILKDDSQLFAGDLSNLPIPEQFVHKVKTDSSAHFSYAKTSKPSIKPDSLTVIDWTGLASFYRNTPTIKIDTLVEEKYNSCDFNQFQYADIKSICDYHYDKKYGNEKTYYNISELKGVVIRKNFRLKSTGHWKNGLMTGKWKYYAPNGDLETIERWKKGKLKHERKISNRN